MTKPANLPDPKPDTAVDPEIAKLLAEEAALADTAVDPEIAKLLAEEAALADTAVDPDAEVTPEPPTEATGPVDANAQADLDRAAALAAEHAARPYSPEAHRACVDALNTEWATRFDPMDRERVVTVILDALVSHVSHGAFDDELADEELASAGGK